MPGNDNVTLRLETEVDYRVVESITREAFWNLHVPGCDEHYLTHVLRQSPDFIPELDFVAVIDDEIVGNIMYAHSIIGAMKTRNIRSLLSDLSAFCHTQQFGVSVYN